MATPKTDTPAQRAPRWRAIATGVAVGAYQLVLTFPGLERHGGAIDRSWWLEINRLPHTAHRFGADLAFTYGPIGFLLHPADFGHNVALAAAARWALALGAAAVAGVWCAGGSAGGTLLLLAGEACAVAFGLETEHFVAVVAGLLGAAAARRGSRLALLALAILAAAAVFMKTTLAACGLAVLALAAGGAIARGRGRGPAAAAVGAYLVATAAFAALLLPSPGDFVGWLARSLELASGFSAAMAYPPEGFTAFATGCGAAVVTGWALLVGWLAWRRSPGFLVAAVLSPLVLVGFKQSFVRLDEWHVNALFALAPVAFGIAGLSAAGWAERAPAAAGICLAALCGTLADARVPQRAPPEFARAALLRIGGANLAFWARPAAARAELAPRRIAPEAENAQLQEVVGSRTFGVYPFQQFLCTVNGIDCVPLPTLQAFAAYTASLDRWMARFFGSDRAPELLLVGFEAIDGKNLVVSTPATLRALRAAYRLAAVQPVADQVLLERRPGRIPGAEPEREILLAEETIPPGVWAAVPNVGEPVRAHLSLRLNATGTIARAALRVPPVRMQLLYSDGRVCDFHLVAATAENGIDTGEIPLDVGELGASFAGRRPAPVVAIELSGGGLDLYRPPVVRWSVVSRAGGSP